MSKGRGDASSHAINRGFSRGFWGTLITLMVLVGGIELYGAMTLHRQISEAIEVPSDREDRVQSREELTEKLEQTQGGPTWRERLINDTFLSASGEYSALTLELRAQIVDSFKRSRRKMDERVDAWADWYFSVIGEYARLGHLGAQAIGQSNLDEFMIEQLSKRVFEPAGVFEDLAALNKEVERRFANRHQEIISHLERVIKAQTKADGRELNERERALVEDKLGKLERLNHVATISPLALAAKLGSLGGVKAGLKFLVSRSAMKAASAGGVKVAASGGAKVAVAGGTKAIAASGAKVAVASGTKIAAAGGTKVAIAGGAKAAVKAGTQASAIASGASATALCAPLGPIAAVCGITAGVVTWFAVDKAIVEIDELINREAFVADTRREFEVLINTLEGEVLSDLDRYQSQVLKLMVSDREEQLDAPPRSTRLVDQIQKHSSEPTGEDND